jgi:hypothetical protein
MMDYSARIPLGVGHRESCQYELASQAISHCPSDDQTGKHIEHNGQIQETFQGRYIGGVRYPQLVGPLCRDSTRSGAQRSGSPLRVVHQNLRFCTPFKPAWRIKRATRLRPTRTP